MFNYPEARVVMEISTQEKSVKNVHWTLIVHQACVNGVCASDPQFGVSNCDMNNPGNAMFSNPLEAQWTAVEMCM